MSIFIETFQCLTKWVPRNWTKFYDRILNSQTAKSLIRMQFYILWRWLKSVVRSFQHRMSRTSITLGNLSTKTIVLLQTMNDHSLILMMSRSKMAPPTKCKSSSLLRIQMRIRTNVCFALPAFSQQLLQSCLQPLWQLMHWASTCGAQLPIGQKRRLALLRLKAHKRLHHLSRKRFLCHWLPLLRRWTYMMFL